MSEEKKTFFASLQPKSALIVGVVAGLLVVCTIGFIVLGIVMVRSKSASKLSANSTSSTTEVTDDAANQTVEPITVTKTDKPAVELFVMSYCPYGLQMEKAFLPVMTLLGKKADLSVKFVSYAMHGEKELDENTRQYCIETEQNAKFVPYLNCFTAKDDYQTCLTAAKIDIKKMDSCVAKTNAKYKIKENYKDQSTWLNGRFPVYAIHDGLNTKYGVQGSPTLIINGAQASVQRSPEAVKQAVCASFNTPPKECSSTLSIAQVSPGFGTSTGSNSTDNAGCAPSS